METLRFYVLEQQPMAVRDTQEGTNIHLGSNIEAVELVELLNGLIGRLKAQSLTILRGTGKTNFLELELERLKAKLKECNTEEHY